MIREIVQGLIVGVDDDREKAERIREYVARTIKHDYKNQPDTFDPEKLIKLGYGRCGHRASLFNEMLWRAGIISTVVIKRGHDYNRVLIKDSSSGLSTYQDFDATIPRHKAEADLIAHIKSGPDYIQNYVPTDYNFPPRSYSSWLKALYLKTNTVLPRDILSGKAVFSDSEPNVVIRHDICNKPEKWMPMVHEENQLGLRSVTYVRVDDESYKIADWVDMFKQFQEEGFEIGLHITAVNRHGLTTGESFDRYKEQLIKFAEIFGQASTVQAHGFDDKDGVPPYTNYDIENGSRIGFLSAMSKADNISPEQVSSERLADSLGVMYPSHPIEWIEHLRKGRLYYCLFHPEYYTYKDEWVRFDGVIHGDYGIKDADRVLPILNSRFNDTPYFNSIEKPHLVTVSEYLAGHVKKYDTVVDLACGWGFLNVLMRKRLPFWSRGSAKWRYVGVDSEYRRVKAAQTLHMALGLNVHQFACGDIGKPQVAGREIKGDWVVFVGWEGDANLDVLEEVPQYVKSGGHLVMSYIDRNQFFDDSWNDVLETKLTNPYVLMSKKEVVDFMLRKGFVSLDTLKESKDRFPRRVIVLKRNDYFG